MAVAKPTRYPKGVNNQASGTPFGDLPVLNRLALHLLDDDFDNYAATQWTVTATTGTTALQAGNGGQVIQSTAATLNDIQANVKLPAAFQIAAGQGAWFAWRGNLANALDNTLQVGLQTGGTFLAPTDGVFFTKAAASASVNLVIRAASVSVTIPMPVFAFANGVNTTLAWYYDGAKLTAWVGTLGQYTSTVSVTAFTTLPTAAVLSPAFGLSAGSAAVRTLTTDYLVAASELPRL